MAGGDPPKQPPSNGKPKNPAGNPPTQPPPSSSHRHKSRWESPSTAAAVLPLLSNKTPSTTSSQPYKSKSSAASNNIPNPQTPKSKPNNHGNKPFPKLPKPSPRADPNPTQSKLPPFPFPDPPSPPSYGFHSLDRRTIALADGSVRSYFALPLDYQDFNPLPLPPRPDFRGPGFGLVRKFPSSPEFVRPEMRHEMGNGFMRGRTHEYHRNADGVGPWASEAAGSSLKRKFVGGEGREGGDGFERQRQQLLQYGKAEGNSNGTAGTSGFHGGSGGGEELRAAKSMRIGEGNNNVGGLKKKSNEVDPAVKKSFLHFVKLVYENVNQKNKYLANGKRGPLQCLACGRSSKDFSDMHSLIMHVYHSDIPNLAADHLGLHKALCILMGWNFRIHPNNSKSYQFLSAGEAAANVNDLIMWPPLVIIQNTITGKGREGRTEGMGNRAMDNYLRDLGFHGGKSKSLYSEDGHLGITLIKFSSDQSGLKEALQLAEYFERDNRGRNGWARVEPLNLSKDDGNNPNLVKFDEETREKKRIFYGYLATVVDFDKIDFETRKEIEIKTRS